jgi:hypothetical protein
MWHWVDGRDIEFDLTIKSSPERRKKVASPRHVKILTTS